MRERDGAERAACVPHNSPIYDWAKLLSMRRIKSDYLPGEKSRARALAASATPTPSSPGSGAAAAADVVLYLL